MHRSPLPSVDSVVNELLAEKVRLKSQSSKGILPLPTESVLAVPSKPYSVYQSKPPRNASDECNFCKKKGHWKAQCSLILKKQQQGSFYKQSHTATVATPRNENQSSESLLEQLQKLLNSQQSHSLNPMTSSFAGLFTSNASGITSSIWVFDSGASHHMSKDLSCFSSLSPISFSQTVHTADGTILPLAGSGSVKTSQLSLPDVYYIPKLAMNLVSISQLCDLGYNVLFSSTCCIVQDPRSKRVIGIGRREGGLYGLVELRIPDVAASTGDLSSFHLTANSSNFYLWHSRLGHVSAYRLKFLASKGSLGQIKPHDISDCSSTGQLYYKFSRSE